MTKLETVQKQILKKPLLTLAMLGMLSPSIGLAGKVEQKAELKTQNNLEKSEAVRKAKNVEQKKSNLSLLHRILELLEEEKNVREAAKQGKMDENRIYEIFREKHMLTMAFRTLMTSLSDLLFSLDEELKPAAARILNHPMYPALAMHLTIMGC